MPRWIGGSQGEQLAMVPLDFRDALAADHKAWFFKGIVDELDMSAFEARYRTDRVGRPPHSPKAILALIMYCLATRRGTDEEMVEACPSDIGARVIMGNVYPCLSVIYNFRRVHREAIGELFVETLRLGEAEGLIDLSVIAGDGTKIAANAAMSSAADEVALQAQIDALKVREKMAFGEWEAAIPAACPGISEALAGRGEVLFGEPEPVPGGRRGKQRRLGEADALWREVITIRTLLASREAALAYLREHPGNAMSDWSERLDRDRARVAACQERGDTLRAALTAAEARRTESTPPGRTFRGRFVPVEENAKLQRAVRALATATTRAEATAKARPSLPKVNTTDPRSRIMPSKHGGFDQNYNFQVMACRNQFILAFLIHDSPNDKEALEPLLKATNGNLCAAAIIRGIGTALADNGYASRKNISTPTTTGTSSTDTSPGTDTDTEAGTPLVDQLLIALEKEGRQAGRVKDGVTTTAAAWEIMRERFDDPANRELYKRRGTIIEPVFAQLFAVFGRAVSRRNANVDTEMSLWCTTHNLLKIMRARAKA